MILKASVRDVAEHAGRTGDLGARHFSLLRGADGIRAHRRVQKNRGEHFRAEVSLETRWEDPAGSLQLRGRADGVEHAPGEPPVIEEIKTTRAPPGEPPADFSVHRLQALLYAWMLQREENCTPRIRLRYVPPDSGAGWCHEEAPDPEALRETAETACRAYARRAYGLKTWREARDATLRDLPFPFAERRPGQDALMQAVADTLRTGGRLHAEAPTGIGKTVAVLRPALRALGQGQCETLFVATSRNTGKTIFEDACRLFVQKGARLRALTLRARDRSCNRTGTPCNCQECPLALGFFDRLEPALRDLRAEPHWDTATWTRIAEAHQVCPFAFLMQAAREADVIIGDLNHALDPSARLHFLFQERPESVALLIDEAHHLPERARDMYSAVLMPADISKALRAFSPALRGLATDLRRVQRAARNLDFTDAGGIPATESPPRELSEACRRALDALELSFNAQPPVAEDPRHPLFQTLSAFRASLERHSAPHILYRDGPAIHHLCRDAAPVLAADLNRLHAAVLFSATLGPMEIFRELTGASAIDRDLRIASPFDPERFPVELETGIPVVRRARGPEMYERLTRRIQQFLEARPGKTLVFLPSFDLLEEVRRRLPPHDLWLGPVLAQPRGLQDTEARAFLAPLRRDPPPVTALAVLGGALNEGIDLPGDALTGVIVVGIGLPAVTPGRELLRAYFDRQGRDGFVMAYTFPGLLRVAQALGRVIRGPEDSGRGLLIDPRFRHPFYREHLLHLPDDQGPS